MICARPPKMRSITTRQKNAQLLRKARCIILRSRLVRLDMSVFESRNIADNGMYLERSRSFELPTLSVAVMSVST